MLKKALSFLLVVLAIGGLYWFAKSQVTLFPTIRSSKLQVVATFYPLAEFAHQVGQDLVEVKNLTPAGTEPHDFDPAPQDLVALQGAKVFIYNGAGFEAWLTQLDMDFKQDKAMVEATKGLPLLKSDPHTWLDPVFASQEVETITQGLIEVDPAHQAQYKQNSQVYRKQLAELDAQFKAGLAECQSREIVTSHNAFQYLAKRYNLSVLSIAGLSPDEEPTPQKLVEVTQFVRQHQVKYIFFETLVSPKLSDTIARETGAKTIAFNPLEGLSGEELVQGKNYLSVQLENLSALRTALNCK